MWDMHSKDEELRGIERFLHGKIPLARAMGVRAEGYEGGTLALSAPLEKNHNHLGTAFGGSLAAMATLAGYGLLWLELGDADAHVVISRSSMRYLRPVRGALHAVCTRPEAGRMALFHKRFAAKGRAQIAVAVKIVYGGEVAVEFEGRFVAVRGRDEVANDE